MFEQHVADAEFGEALGLWRGGPLAEFAHAGSLRSSEIARLEELELSCLERRIDADLAEGSTPCSSESSKRSYVSTRFASGYERS